VRFAFRQVAEKFVEHSSRQGGRVTENAGLKLKGMKCAAMERWVDESKELLGEIEKGEVLDAARLVLVKRLNTKNSPFPHFDCHG